MNTQIEKLIALGKTLPWTDQEFYSRWMAQIYFLTLQSVKMIAAAASVTERPDFQRHLISQIRQEMGHDKIALSDLRALGRDPKEFSESGLTRSLWESQFHKIQRNPDALLGYTYALEATAVDLYGDVLPKIAAKFGDKAVKFVRLHAEEDQEHVVEARKQIDALNPKSKAEALANADQACAIITALIFEIKQQIKSRSASKAA